MAQADFQLHVRNPLIGHQPNNGVNVPSYWVDLGANKTSSFQENQGAVQCIFDTVSKHPVTDFIYNLWVSAVTAISLVAGFFYVYFIRYPLKDLCFCFGGNEEWRRFKQAFCGWLVVSCAVVYGIFQALRGVQWIFEGLKGENVWCVILARASGKLTTFLVLLSLVFVIRPLTSSVNEIPEYKRSNLGWRRIHIDLVLLSMIFGAIHSTFQGIRIAYYFTDRAYEAWFGGTGAVLWAFFLVHPYTLSSPHPHTHTLSLPFVTGPRCSVLSSINLHRGLEKGGIRDKY